MLFSFQNVATIIFIATPYPCDKSLQQVFIESLFHVPAIGTMC